jgi:hypothetical protein
LRGRRGRHAAGATVRRRHHHGIQDHEQQVEQRGGDETYGERVMPMPVAHAVSPILLHYAAPGITPA